MEKSHMFYILFVFVFTSVHYKSVVVADFSDPEHVKEVIDHLIPVEKLQTDNGKLHFQIDGIENAEEHIADVDDSNFEIVGGNLSSSARSGKLYQYNEFLGSIDSYYPDSNNYNYGENILSI